MRDSFIVYRSFYEAIFDLPKEIQAEIFCAICEYSLNEKIPEISGVSSTVFKLMKPLLDANNQRYKNGKKAKRKQNVSKPQAKGKQTRSKSEGNKDVNVDDNVNVHANEKREIRIEDVISYFLEKGYSEFAARKFFNFYSVTDWKDSKGNKVKNWKQKAIGVWFKPENEIVQQPEERKKHVPVEEDGW